MREHNLSDFLDRIALPIMRYICARMNIVPPDTVPHWMNWVYAVILVIGIMGFISITAMFLIWWERKVCGQIQNRTGPMQVGYPRSMSFYKNFMLKHRWWGIWCGGWLQTAMDSLKLLLKEDIIPARADRLIFITAPFIVMASTFMAFVIIPFGPGVIVRDLNIGLLYFLAAGSLVVISIVMGGWGSNNKYALIGGLRSAAQLISYEIPMVFALLSVILLAGSIKMGDIVNSQMHNSPIGWNIIPLTVGFIVYMIAAVAETNRPPFDLPEAESEIVAGFNIEYSGMRFAMFFLAEFTNMFIVCAIAATTFLGGWTLPGGFDLVATIQSWHLPEPNLIAAVAGVVIFLAKTYFLIFIMIWTRWTFPRLRGDQLMGFGWKILLPLSFLNLLIACVWAMVMQ